LTCAGAGDVKSGDRGEVASGPDSDFFFAVQDPKVSVFDDDGDDLAGVAGAEPDALSGDHDLAVGVHFALCSQPIQPAMVVAEAVSRADELPEAAPVGGLESDRASCRSGRYPRWRA
jgi:hypothetical protein